MCANVQWMQRISYSVSLLLYCNNCGNFVLPIAFAVVHPSVLLLLSFFRNSVYKSDIVRPFHGSTCIRWLAPGGLVPFLFSLWASTYLPAYFGQIIVVFDGSFRNFHDLESVNLANQTVAARHGFEKERLGGGCGPGFVRTQLREEKLKTTYLSWAKKHYQLCRCSGLSVMHNQCLPFVILYLESSMALYRAVRL